MKNISLFLLIVTFVLTVIPTLAKANSGDFSSAVAIGTSYAGGNTAPSNGLIVQGEVGIGTAAPVNSLDISGAAVIGSSYAGVATAPSNGVLVQGNVGIGNTSPGALLDVGLAGTTTGTIRLEGGSSGYVQIQPSGAAGSWTMTLPNSAGTNGYLLSTDGSGNTSWVANDAGSTSPLPPGGRLTLSSNTPVMTTDLTAATTVYYADYVSDLVPIYNGTNWLEYSLGGQISLALDSTSGHTGYQQSGKLFDLVIRNNSGTPQLCTGPAWSSSTARASSIAMQNGIWTNSGSWTVKCDATSSTFSCSANQCTYVGTMYATANGQTEVLCAGYAVGGASDVTGISNAYNQVPISCIDSDTSSTWTYSSSTWRAANNHTANGISVINSLAQNALSFFYTTQASNNGAGNAAYIGIGTQDSSSTYSRLALMTAPTGVVGDNWQQLFVNYSQYPTPLSVTILGILLSIAKAEPAHTA
jgi:hypothetical protein